MISVVIPIYNEESLIPQLHATVCAVLDSLGMAWELIYVDDGSSDSSLEKLKRAQAEDNRVTVLELSRNWGHQSAISAGLAHAEGQAIILMDGDMQDPPDVIPELVSTWKKGGEVVIAQRYSRQESGLRCLLIPLFYKFFGFLSDYPIPLNAGIFGLLDRKAADAILNLGESNRYLPGLRAWVGFRTQVVSYHRAVRASGEPKQTFWRLLKYGLDAIFSFSYKPLRLSLLLGLATACFALGIAVIFVLSRLANVGLFGNPVVVGYTSIVVSVLLLGGIQLISVGIVGEYIGRIYDEVKKRPLYLVSRVHKAQLVHERGRVHKTGSHRP